MGTHYGKGFAETLNGALVDLVSGTFYSARINIQSVRIGLSGKKDEIISQAGEIDSLIYSASKLEATFEVIPSAATKADAQTYGCSMPARGTAFHASGFGTVAIPLGPFTVSGINSTGSSPSAGADTMPWFFDSGELNMMADGKWTVSWTMSRYKNVTSGTAIT